MTTRRDRIEKLAHALAFADRSVNTDTIGDVWNQLKDYTQGAYRGEAELVLSAMTRAGLVVRLRGEKRK